jgi:hypothetical protein
VAGVWGLSVVRPGEVDGLVYRVRVGFERRKREMEGRTS